MDFKKAYQVQHARDIISNFLGEPKLPTKDINLFFLLLLLIVQRVLQILHVFERKGRTTNIIILSQTILLECH
jgi:hypothetical protein